MGLDMYLRVSLYTSKYSQPVVNEQLCAIKIDHPSGFPTGEQNLGSVSIEWEAMYWRKANQIHQWFVENVQSGTDDCGDYRVSVEQLTELRDICRALLASKDPDEAKEKLPPQSGFFFGGTDIDDWYWEDVKHTEEGLSRILAHPEVNRFNFEYHSSW